MALDFIDHNELGEAFEWIVGVLANRQLAVDHLARAPLAAAAAELRLDDHPMWVALSRSA